VALCSQSVSADKRIISTAANYFGALGFGLPSGVSLPNSIKIHVPGGACREQPNRRQIRDFDSPQICDTPARKVLKTAPVVTNFYTTLTMNLYKQETVWPNLKLRSMTPMIPAPMLMADYEPTS
jgi:hypothetical protein